VHNWVSKQQLSKIFNSWWNLLKCWLYSFKALLASSHHFSEIAHLQTTESNFQSKSKSRKMIAHKQAVVDQTSGG
jgi:hypothetical protein